MAKETNQIEDIFKKIQKRNRGWIDRLTFPGIFLIWVIIVVIFGMVYYFFTTSGSHLLHNQQRTVVTALDDDIYFSFVTATTTGFGDIVPIGNFKWVSIFEVIFGFLLLALVTSKLVSIKQNALLNEVYELSFSDRINKLRSSYLQLRQNLDRIIAKVEESRFQTRELHAIYIYVSSLEGSLAETVTLLAHREDKEFIRSLDAVNTELIINNVIGSFEKIHELLVLLKKKRVSWQAEEICSVINKCLALNEEVFKDLGRSETMSKHDITDLSQQNKALVDNIRKHIC